MKNHVNVHEPVFDPSNIVIGDPVYIRKRFSYIGHAATTYSVEHALAIIEHIGIYFIYNHYHNLMNNYVSNYGSIFIICKLF